MKLIDARQTARHALCHDLAPVIPDAAAASRTGAAQPQERSLLARPGRRAAPRPQAPDCNMNADVRDIVELEEAVSLITAGFSPLGTEVLPLEQALGRVLAAEAKAVVDQPPFDCSPLDGYALRAADSVAACPKRPVRLRVVDTLYAGDVANVPVLPGQAVRIMTGAMLPAGCDCVLKQEDTDQGYPVVSIYKSLRAHDNYINRGAAFLSGMSLLPQGARLDAASLGLLANAGLSRVTLNRRPVVALLATGDELIAPGTFPLPEGKIYGSNAYMFSARVEELGFARPRAEHAGDNPAVAAAAMARLLERADLLITTGGLSVGARDILHQALILLGAELVFRKVKLRPGNSALCSRYHGKAILSLSGNPFAAAATFELLGRPLLATLAGEPGLITRRASGVLNTPFLKASPGRRFVRGKYADGQITLPEGHAAGVPASLVGCNCLLDIPAGSGPLKAGQNASIWLL